MEAVVGLMVLLLGVSHGEETSCDGRQDGAQCYGALGGAVDIQLMNRTSETLRYHWKWNDKIILDVRANIILTNNIENRSSFTSSNGTFRINNLSRNDGGKYILEIFDSSGRKSEQRSLHLSIQAPVSSVLLLSECLSEGEMRASCSSEGGDSPQYSWTLDGRTLTEAELLSGDAETNSITLKQHISGRLVCSVRNHVSRVSQEENISTCGFIFINCTLSNGTLISQWVFAANNTLCVAPTTHPTTVINNTVGKETEIIVSSSVKPTTHVTSSNQTVTSVPWLSRPQNLHIMAGVLSALLLLLVVGLAVICTHMKKKSNKPKEEDNDLTYADVQIMQRPGGKQVQQRQEVEVEYGQVKFSAGHQQSAATATDECVYAKVCRDR